MDTSDNRRKATMKQPFGRGVLSSEQCPATEALLRELAKDYDYSISTAFMPEQIKADFERKEA